MVLPPYLDHFVHEAGRFPLTLLALPHIGDYPLGSVAQEISRAISPGAKFINRVRKLLMKVEKRPIGYSGFIRLKLSEKIYRGAMS